ncbi:MAG TPA: LptA/OstA family protein [Opitutaceae bacterium]|nr:LptA/OstA family protein [Opitutaceae bacterium]HWA10273.1 LptA/OstA family protein [Opitutaceae bacterium]
MKFLRLLALGLVLPAAPFALAADAPAQSTELQCDHGEMWTVNSETRAIFTGNVTLTGTNLRITCDRMEIIAEGIGDKTATMPTLEKFKYLLATGHVHIVQGEREATSGRAELLPREDKIVLTEDPVVIDHGEGWAQAAEKITMLRGERRVITEKPRFTGPSIKDLGFDKSKSSSAGEAAPDATKK